MNSKKPPLQPDPAWLQAFTTLMSRIDTALGPAKLKKPVVICIAGGAAMHFYTGERYSRDVDARIFARIMIDPQELQVAYQGHDGRARLLYFDTQYSDSFALLHQTAYDDARSVRLAGITAQRLDVKLLMPVDLAISKLSRFSVQDQDDIHTLARHGLITSAPLRKRAEAALPDYVGNLERIRNSISIACKQLDEITRGKAGNDL